MEEVLPWLGAALTGGVPALATMAANKLIGVFGSPEIPEKVSEEQKAMLLQIEKEIKLEAMRMGYMTLQALVNAEVSDKASARQMQVEALKQDSYLAKNFVYILAGFWTLAAVVYIGFVTFGTIPDSNVRFADTILGFLLGTVISTIINFFMGTSFSNKLKDESINNLVKDAK